MISTDAPLTTFRRQRSLIIKEIDEMREKVEDLWDSLDLLEAQARNRGKPTYTTEEVKRKLGIK